MIKIDLTSPDVDRQMEVLRHFPDLAEKHYRPVVKRDVSLLEALIEGQIPTRTGTALSTFGSKVTGRGFRIRGQVGWYDSNDPRYITIVESGAEPHRIEPRPENRPTRARIKSGRSASGVLAFPSTAQGGDFAFIRGADHPGFSGRGFMAAGASAMQAMIENDLALANERIIADLAAI
jgi:hypothetical protein